MRVLFYLADRQWTGAARAMLAAARGLGARGHGITVACCAGTRTDRAAEALGVDRIAINSDNWLATESLDLRRTIKDRLIEVAVVGTEREQLIVASGVRAAGRGVVLRRVPSGEPLEMQRSGRLALKLAPSGVIVSSEQELDGVRTGAWIIPPVVVPLGVDAAAYAAATPVTRRALQVPDERMLITCIYDAGSRFRMGVVFRTVALLALRQRRIHVVVEGPGSRDDDLRMHAAALGVGPVMSFLGEREDARGVIRASDAGWVVASADAGAFGCLDLMALGVPAIAARTPLTDRYLTDGGTGILLADDDPSVVASALSAVVFSPERRAALAAAARARVEQDFSESAMLDAFEHAVNAAGARARRARS